MITHIQTYSDGGARGNPGPAGAGAVLYEVDDTENKKIIAEISEYLGETTNNQAEYRALIFALEKAKELRYKIVDAFLDSELVVKQLNGEYKVKNQDLAKRFLEVRNLMTFFDKVTFNHVRRAFNKEADALVNQAIDASM